MTFHMHRRTVVRIISFTAAAVAVLAGFWISTNHQFKTVERQLIHGYQSALESLSTSMDDMAVTLEKSLYAGTPASLSGLTGELVLQAGTAGAALSSLPVDSTGLETISKFISQVSDYSLVLSKKAVNGGTITEQERESLSSLASVAANLSTRLEEARTVYNSSGNWDQSIRSALSGAQTVSGLSDSLTEAEESLNDYPTLIYDGPFSDHISTRESVLLENAGTVSQEQALQKAAAALSLSPEKLQANGEEQGSMPAYLFRFDSGTAAVTKQGGYLSYFRKERDVSSSEMSYEQAVEKAKAYIGAAGLGSFEETYFFTDEGICVVNFCYKQDGTLCYTDLIKVGVAMDNGEIMLYEARGFLMNHKPRTLKTPVYSADRARQVLSPYLSVQSVAAALIPSGGMEELFCYEFHCTGQKDEDILVYINTDTLAEEQLLILLKTDGGTLTK